MGKGKDMGEELSGMLRGVPPQNILIAFDDKPAKSLADLKEQQNDPQHQQSNQPQPASPSHPDSPEPGDSNGHSQPNNPNQPGENPAAG